MNEKKTDRRIRKTETALQNALKELLKTKSLSKISVTELCEKADVNRNTFYSHYQFPEDVLRPLEDEFYSAFIKTIIEPSLDDKRFVNYCRFLKANREDFEVLFSENYDFRLLERINALSLQNAFDELEYRIPGIDESKKQYLIDFTIGGCTAVITKWIKGGMKETPEDITEFLNALTRFGSDSFKK